MAQSAMRAIELRLHDFGDKVEEPKSGEASRKNGQRKWRARKNRRESDRRVIKEFQCFSLIILNKLRTFDMRAEQPPLAGLHFALILFAFRFVLKQSSHRYSLIITVSFRRLSFVAVRVAIRINFQLDTSAAVERRHSARRGAFVMHRELH